MQGVSRYKTHHVKLPIFVKCRGEGEGGDAAGDEGNVSVDDASVLVIPGSSASVEGGPVQPQKHGTWRRGGRVGGVQGVSASGSCYRGFFFRVYEV